MIYDLAAWVVQNPEVGWVVVVIYLVIEIRSPKGKINNHAKRIESVVIVVRALGQVHEDIDTQKVDAYLTKNGSEPNDFIEDSQKASDGGFIGPVQDTEEPGEDGSRSE